MLVVLVALQWLPHVKCVFAVFSTCWVVAVIFDHAAENTVPARSSVSSGTSSAFYARVHRVSSCSTRGGRMIRIRSPRAQETRRLPHAFVHADGVVPLAHEQVDEPRICRLALSLELSGQRARDAHAAILWRHRQGRDVPVPGQVAVCERSEGWILLELADYCGLSVRRAPLVGSDGSKEWGSLELGLLG